MTTINGRACVANGRNLYLNSKTIADGYGINGAAKVTIEPFDSTTNMWHIVAAQGTGGGIYFFNYAKEKLPDTTDWSYSADVKGIGKPYMFGIEAGSHTPVVGTVGSEWSRISQSGRIVNSKIKTIAMYFSSTNSPVDVYIKLPKLEIGTTSTPLTPAPVDKVFSNGKQVYGRNLALRTATPFTMTGNGVANNAGYMYRLSRAIAKGTTVTVSFDITSKNATGVYTVQLIDGAWQGSDKIPFTEGTKHQSYTIMTASVYSDGFQLRLDNSTATVTISNFIISKSSKELPYSPAPEDVLKGDVTTPNNLVGNQSYIK